RARRTPPPAPLPLGFSQVFILKVVKVLCFDTLLKVLFLKEVSQRTHRGTSLERLVDMEVSRKKIRFWDFWAVSRRRDALLNKNSLLQRRLPCQYKFRSWLSFR